MWLLKESLEIFRRNPLNSLLIVLLIAAASLGQVISLGSLYPILQVLISDQPANTVASNSVFASVLTKIGAVPTLTNLLILFIALGAGYSILNWLSETFQAFHLRNIETAIRHDLFESAVAADWTYARGLRHGEFINVISKEAAQYKFVVKYSLYTIGSFLQFAALLLYALYLNWQLTSFGLSIFALGSLVLVPLLKSTNQLGQESVQLANQMTDRLVAALRSLKMVKALSLESFLVRTLHPSFKLSASNYFRQGVLASGQYAVTEILAFAAISSMLYVGLNVLAVPKAELFIILVLLFRALPQVRAGIDNYQRAYGALPSMDIVRQHINAAAASRAPEGGTPIPDNWKQVEFDSVSFAYKDSSVIVNDLSLSIHRGEFWAIVGQSGSGKTTLLDLLLGLLRPQAGSVRVDNVPLTKADLRSWHAQVAYLGQDAFAFAGTLRENLTWGIDAHVNDSDLLSALRSARLDSIGALDAGILDRNVGENGSNLSGGEKQRLALARLFLRKPGLLILDEPTTGLDASTEKDIFESISQFFRSTTLIMVSHREELTKNADHVICFSPAGIVQTPEKDISASPQAFPKTVR
jgi:ABC-type bacteriocin/lantibiotic exporter with double-glycine peptidase domain